MRLILAGLALCIMFAAADAQSFLRSKTGLPQSPVRKVQATSLCTSPRPPDEGACKAVCVCANHVSNCAWTMTCP